MDPKMMVKQFVAEVHGKHSSFRVFTTGDRQFYLFSQIHEGIETGLQFPVKKSDLRDDVRRGLAHGWGYDARGESP